MSGLLWIQTLWHFDGIHKIIFEKVNFEKNQQKTKSMKNYPEGKEFYRIRFLYAGLLPQNQYYNVSSCYAASISLNSVADDTTGSKLYFSVSFYPTTGISFFLYTICYSYWGCLSLFCQFFWKSMKIIVKLHVLHLSAA